MKNEIIITLLEKNKICSIDDKMITNINIILEKEKAIKCFNEIIKILKKEGYII